MPNKIQPITNRKINIALVGCGRISQNHIKSIGIHNQLAKLTAICDPSTNQLDDTQTLIDEIKTTKNIPFERPKQFTNYSELITEIKNQNIPVDLVVLTTPSGLHAEQVITAANAGLHVCTEKPMATEWKDGQSMVKCCDQACVHLFVVKQNRFNSTLQLVKKQLKAGRFGKLAMVTVNVFWHRPQSYYDQASWRGTWGLDGGALMNQASHYVDLLDWLVGPVETISTSIATLGRCIEVEDTAAMQLRWRNGALGTMAVTMLTYPKNLEGSITLLGETGTVRIGGPAVNQIEHWEFADKSPDDKLVAEASYTTTSVYGFGHPIYYENMLKTLQGKDQALCNGREGLRSLEILIGAYRSAHEEKIIHLPLEQ